MNINETIELWDVDNDISYYHKRENAVKKAREICNTFPWDTEWMEEIEKQFTLFLNGSINEVDLGDTYIQVWTGFKYEDEEE